MKRSEPATWNVARFSCGTWYAYQSTFAAPAAGDTTQLGGLTRRAAADTAYDLNEIEKGSQK